MVVPSVDERNYTVGLVVEIVLDQPILHDGWRMTPLTLEDSTYETAIRATLALAGISDGPLQEGQTPPLDAVLITVLQPAADPDAAIDDAQLRLDRLADALGLRQMWQGRRLAYIAWGHQEIAVSMPYVHHALLTHELPDGASEVGELGAFAAALADERSSALVRLYRDAMRDASTIASLTPLWSLLETLSEDFRGTALAKVSKAIEHVGIARTGPLRRAYALRNAFVHGGETGDEAEVSQYRSELAFTAWSALGRSRFRLIDPHGPRQQPTGDDVPIRRIKIHQPRQAME